MDMQMIMPVLFSDPFVDNHTIPVVVFHTNVSPISHAALQDRNLINDVQPLASQSGMDLYKTSPTDSLLHLLLYYQKACDPRKVDRRVKNAIAILEAAWYADIERWSQNKSLLSDDVITGKIIWNGCLTRFIRLILHSLQTRRAYIYFDDKDDISGKRQINNLLRLCYFYSYCLNRKESSLDLIFQVNNQLKRLILPFNDIKKFDDLGIYFQHPARPDCILSNPFYCNGFKEPHTGSDTLKRDLDSEI